jgi:hypothetical protein
MLEKKSKPNNGWGSHMAQPLNSGRFFGTFPIEIGISKIEVRTW